MTWPICANFSLPRPLCSRVRPDVRHGQTDRQTDVRHASSLNVSALWGRGHNGSVVTLYDGRTECLDIMCFALAVYDLKYCVMLNACVVLLKDI